jgi:hypothetical protein
MFLALTTTVAWALVLELERYSYRVPLLLLVACAGFLTLATLSRSAILALALGIVLPLAIKYPWRTPAAIALGAVVGFVLAPEFLIIRFTRSTFFIREVPALGIEIPIGTLWKRINGWVLLSEIFADNPLFGGGFSLSRFQTDLLYDRKISPDNHYIGVLVETGLVGLIVFTLWVRAICSRLIRGLSNEDTFGAALATGVLAAFFGFLVWGFFQGFYARWRVLGPLFIYVGLVYAATGDTTTKHDRG